MVLGANSGWWLSHGSRSALLSIRARRMALRTLHTYTNLDRRYDIDLHPRSIDQRRIFYPYIPHPDHCSSNWFCRKKLAGSRGRARLDFW